MIALLISLPSNTADSPAKSRTPSPCTPPGGVNAISPAASRLKVAVPSADAGKILLNGNEIQDRPIHLRAKAGIGYLSQQRSVFAMSVYDNILGICQLSIKGEENQIKMTEHLLDEFNLQHLRNIHASNLSGGEVRRVMLARLLINNPSVVLLDEPMAALDPIVVQDIQKYILKLQNFGCAILVTDHQVSNLFDIVDRAYELGEQSIIAKGTPSEILKSSKAIELYFGSSYRA